MTPPHGSVKVAPVWSAGACSRFPGRKLASGISRARSPRRRALHRRFGETHIVILHLRGFGATLTPAPGACTHNPLSIYYLWDESCGAEVKRNVHPEALGKESRLWTDELS